MHLVLDYRRTGGAIAVDVPALAVTARQAAQSAYAFTHQPPPGRCSGEARLIAAAYYDHERPAACPLLPLAAGDRVHAAGCVLEVVAETGEVDVWGLPVAAFREVERCGGPGPVVPVSGRVPPPDQVAYAEDSRDRVWTGKGAGIWTCLTDPAGRAAPASWWRLWEEHGPLVPLVPATPDVTAV